jgi:acyl-coenzyme A thioesterase PaaI-like protein
MATEINDDDTVTATAPVLKHACQPGTDVLRTSVLATWADVVTGTVASHAILPRIPVTLDLETQVVRPARSGTNLSVVSRPVKVGRTISVSDARFFDATTGDLLAYSLATFMASPNPEHTMGRFPKSMPAAEALAVPLAERVQRRIVEPGVVEMPRLPDGLNATGAIQGGLQGLCIEEAAASLTTEPGILGMLNIRYFRPVNAGPARATATREGRLFAVELIDTASGKVGAMATARWTPLDGPELG